MKTGSVAKFQQRRRKERQREKKFIGIEFPKAFAPFTANLMGKLKRINKKTQAPAPINKS